MIKIKKSEFKKLYDTACTNWKSKFDDRFRTQVFSDNLEFEDGFLDEMQKACDSKQLAVFNVIFKPFIKEDLFSSTKTYTEVCKKLKVKELKLKDFIEFGEDARKMLAFHKIKNLERLFNGDWKADLKNPNQNKYYPYFTVNSSGGFVFYGCYYGDSAFAGHAGLFKDSRTAEFVGKTFPDIYQDLV